MRDILWIILVSLAFLCPAFGQEEQWQQLKDKHFVVYYQDQAHRETAQKVLRKAESYYRSLGKQIGYQRYTDFWTWEERVKIILFPSRESFMESTGQPAWSLGYAGRDPRLFVDVSDPAKDTKPRTILTYPQEQNFLDGLLPHEIGHLIIRDFIPVRGRLPVWFEEGIAQLQEREKAAVADEMMKALVHQGQYINLDFLMQWDIRQEDDPFKVEVFYAQSLSIVRFLIKKYGEDSFERLCRNLRDGAGFEKALQEAYTNQIGSISDLQNKWVSFIGR